MNYVADLLPNRCYNTFETKTNDELQASIAC